MKEQKEGTKKREINIYSLKTKMVLLLLIVIIITTGINIWTAIPLASDSLSNVNQNYLYDLVVAYGDEVDKILSESNGEYVEALK